MKDFTRLVFISDLHIPFQDTKAIAVVLRFLEDYQPEKLILGGDIHDFYSISRFDKSPERLNSLQAEIDTVHQMLVMLKHMLPNTEIVYIEGNHEARLKKYLWSKAPELNSLRVLNVPSLLGLDELGIAYYPLKAKYKLGPLFFTHGSVIRKHSGYTAKAMMEKLGVNVVFGHSHRTGKHNKTNEGGNRGAYESGCLCDLNPEYMDDIPDWQHGLSVVEYYEPNEIFFVSNIDIVEYSFVFQGKYYRLENDVTDN